MSSLITGGMRIGIAVDSGCLLHDMGPDQAESPPRLATLIALLESDALTFPGRVSLPTRLVEPSVLALVHTAKHVEQIKQTEGHTVRLDADTSTCPESYVAALRAAGATLEAVDSVFDGRADRSFAIVRPPGHHAEPNRAMGFCLFNSVAVAAEHARQVHGAKRIAIVDFDVHHGNGTQAAFFNDPDILYVSTHQFPWYPGTGAAYEVGESGARGTTLNIPLRGGHGDSEYDAIYGGLLSRVLESFEPELILVSAGFDMMDGDPHGGMFLSASGVGRIAEHLVAAADRLCDGRLVMVLEGGYNLDNLKAGVTACITAMSRKSPEGQPLVALLEHELGDARRSLDIYRDWYTL
ncbi:MAG: acetoin utilization deacetylase AcuC-like enzyme [Myxococcota bacterium]|jgi:acetoin utilization deacetylase AcuC-like enzyme